jgi:hypothetical protein
LLAGNFRVASLDDKLIGTEMDRSAPKQDILTEMEKLRQEAMGVAREDSVKKHDDRVARLEETTKQKAVHRFLAIPE